MRDIKLWTDVYLGSESNYNMDSKSDVQSNLSEPPNHYMTKTRSYGDLINEGAYMNQYNRRCSDPSINCESYVVLITLYVIARLLRLYFLNTFVEFL